MIRTTLIVASVVLAFSGCGRVDTLVTSQVSSDDPAAKGQAQQPTAPAGNEAVKTPLVRALVQIVDEIKGESPEVKDSLKRTLQEADKELGKVLGGKSRQLIVQANQRAPVPMIGGPVCAAPQTHREKSGTPLVQSLIDAIDQARGESPEVKDKLKRALREVQKDLDRQAAKQPRTTGAAATTPSAAPAQGDPVGSIQAGNPLNQPGAVKPQASAATASQPGKTSGQPGKSSAAPPSASNSEVKTPIVRALIQAIGEVEDEGAEVKDGMKKTLREADKELSTVLGGNSQRLIMKANQKPPVPVVCEPNRTGVKVLEFRSPKRDPAAPETPKAKTPDSDPPAVKKSPSSQSGS
jgi:hypothetical protein